MMSRIETCPGKRILSSLFILCAGFFLPFNVLQAQTLESLQEEGKLEIQTRIVPQDNIIAMQQIELQIEVATDKWFSGGTAIGRFEIKDAIVLQREKFAVNSTRVEAGITWVAQIWSLTIYPQRAGRFDIPGIPLTLSIAGEGLEKIQGQLITEPVSFSASIPDELQGKNSWVASPEFRVKESFNREITNFKPGDALIRTITFSAQDTPAMMLPTVSTEKIEGIGLYYKPAQLSDKVNRGDYLSERTETLTYVFEDSGEYELPGEIFYWWDLKKQALQEITLPAQYVTVGIAAKTSNSSLKQTDTEREGTVNYDKRILLTLLVGLIIISLYIFKWRRKNRSGGDKRPVTSQRRLQSAFRRACRQQDSKKAIALLYQYLDYFGGEKFEGAIRPLLSDAHHDQDKIAFDVVMRATFTDSSQPEPDMQKFANQFAEQLRGLAGVDKRWPDPIELKLN